jgi:hypothetical protein
VKRNARNSTHSRSSASGLCSRYRLAAEPPGDFTLFVTLWRKSIARCSPTCRKLPRGETPGKFTRKNSWRPFNPNLVLHKSLPSPANEFAAPNSLNPALAAQIQSLQSDFASVGAVSNCLASPTAWHHRRTCPERSREAEGSLRKPRRVFQLPGLLDPQTPLQASGGHGARLPFQHVGHQVYPKGDQRKGLLQNTDHF